MQYLWKNASKQLKLELKVLRTCIFPIATNGCETWVLRKLDIKRINAFEMKCYRKILRIRRIPWIAHRTNCSILNELHLPTNWLYNFVRRQKLKYFGHGTRHNGLEKTIMQGMIAGKRSRDKDGRKTSQIRLVRWQQQAKWRRTGISFAVTSGQRRPDEDMLREEEVSRNN